MDKEIVIQNLRTKLGDDKSSAISDQTFSAFVDMFLPAFADDSKITDDTWTQPVNILSTFAGQKRHDDKIFTEKYAAEFNAKHEAEVQKQIEEAKKKAIEDYLKANPAPKPEPKPDETKTVDEKIANAVAEALAGLTKEDGVIGKLTASFNSFIEKSKQDQREQELKSVKSILSEYLKGKGAFSVPTIEDALKDITYGETLDVESLKKEAERAYEERYKRYFGNGVKPLAGKPTPGNNNEVSAEIAAYIKQQQENAKQQATYQEDLMKSFM